MNGFAAVWLKRCVNIKLGHETAGRCVHGSNIISAKESADPANDLHILLHFLHSGSSSGVK